jgi:glycerophosphoryl diester phosphodiesterase
MALIYLASNTASGNTPAWSVAKRHADAPIVIAHRGASRLAPENTISAIKRARALGAKAVEFDVHQSADGEIVVIHDATLGRTTNGKGFVSRAPWSKLRTLDAGSWFSKEFTGEPIPRLRDALEALGEDMVAAIEIKTGAAVMVDIRTELERTGTTDRAIIFSFKPHQIRAAAKIIPDVPSLFLVEPENGDSVYPASIVARAKAMGADMIGLYHRAVEDQIVEASHNAGLPLFVYTVDEDSDVRRMVDLGVDGIISNHPRATESRINRFQSASKQTGDDGKNQGPKE